MDKVTLLLLLPLLFVLALVSQGHAQSCSPYGEEHGQSSSPFGEGHGQSCSYFGKEKVTRLHFFYSERVTGDKPTIVLSAKPENNPSAGIETFGALSVIDTPLTEGEDLNSKVVGRAQGLVVAAGLDKTMLIFAVDFEFTSGEYSGSSISVLSRNPILDVYRELAVVGGRGKFRMARGYALLRKAIANADVNIIEYDVTVFHY
ncbi:dirigent protein 11-like [Dioscorea cayenensis subsp. rotundata]|uniref:Dirigent protein n=1 Tax=Dioscorea cayennensis subsp. rotundata TaxID=55577 RepID=A0AB40AVY7_DIOCR|nr:dirigent protein 11-like [Dioscorea cayenensis subsp. rotundata]